MLEIFLQYMQIYNCTFREAVQDRDEPINFHDMKELFIEAKEFKTDQEIHQLCDSQEVVNDQIDYYHQQELY